MLGTRARRSLVAFFAAGSFILSYSGPIAAQADDDEKMRRMQQQIDELQRELQQLRQEQQAQRQEQQAQRQEVAAVKETTTKATDSISKTEAAYNNFLKGFFGTLDVSMDYTTKGMNGFLAYPYSYAPGVTPSYTNALTGPFVAGPAKGNGAGPVGRVGWLASMSSNGSNVGYRGTHQIGSSDYNFIYQVSTALNMVAAPGVQNTWTKQSNTVQGAIGLGDTYVGFTKQDWGRLRFGELFLPYKSSTDRLNPFSGMLGDYSVIMGNTGGDNRVEFGTRLDHVIDYSSPTFSGFSFDAAWAVGQNPDTNSNIVALGSVDCYGGNLPGSGNLPLNCDDGGFDDAYSFDVKFEAGGLYLTAAYERHKKVNRSSDGDGSNSPYYGYLVGLGPNNPLSAALLDWADYQAFAAEYPQAAPAGSPEFSTAYDVADEWAFKIGGQYSFEFGLTISYMYEDLHRDVPEIMEWQNERQRNGDWVAIEQDFNGGGDRFALGWAHAGATPGDPGGQHNYNPSLTNQANMYTFAWWHKFDKQLTWYFNAADTSNDGNAHYDLGAGGHGIKTDCHDATHVVFVDYSSAGPTTWGGCHELGLSTGINFKF